jgi:hypothetical protein
MTVRRPVSKPTAAEIERVIEAGGRPTAKLERRQDSEPVRFQMVVPPELCAAIDGARSFARVSRRAWLLEAAEERLRREGRL